MIVANLKFTTDLDRGVRMTMLRNALFVGDQDAHRFIVSCFRSTSRQPVDLTGAGVTGYFIRADQSTVVIDGKVEDNCAVLTLPAACYAKQGRFSLVIKASLGDVIHTILWVEGAVSVSHTGAIIDPGEVVPTLDELLAQIAAMEQATAAATTATETANAAAAQAVEIATAKGNEALQNVADAVTAQNETIGQLTEEIDEYNAFINRKNLLTNPCFVEEFGKWVVFDNGVAANTVEYVSTNNIAQAMRIVSNGEKALTVVNVVDKRDLVTGHYVARYEVLNGTVGWHRIAINAVNANGEDIETIFRSEAVKGIGTLEAEFDLNVDDIKSDYIGFVISMVDVCDCIVSEPYLAIDSGYNDFYARDIYRLPVPEIPYNKIIGTAVKPEDTTFVERVKSINLFNKDDVVNGEYYVPQTGGIASDKRVFRCLIPVTQGVYTFAGAQSVLGGGVTTVPLYDADGAYVASVTGATVGDAVNGQQIINYSITENHLEQGVTFAGYSGLIANINNVMYVKSDEYPDEYVPYTDYLNIPRLHIGNDQTPSLQENFLYGKKAVFDGDSICYGGGSSVDAGGGGWATRIGKGNSMVWSNVGVSGGTITSEQYSGTGAARHWLSTYIDTIYANHPKLDYLILEGGTNDADLLSNDKIGTLDPDDFSGEYDATTFYGALDTLFYKATAYYPHAKIGFIIAQRMGTSTASLTRRRAYFDRVIEACNKWAIPYIDLWQSGQLNPNLLAYYDSSIEGSTAAAEAGKAYYDGQHLTRVGYDILSPKIEAWMRTL